MWSSWNIKKQATIQGLTPEEQQNFVEHEKYLQRDITYKKYVQTCYDTDELR